MDDYSIQRSGILGDNQGIFTASKDSSQSSVGISGTLSISEQIDSPSSLDPVSLSITEGTQSPNSSDSALSLDISNAVSKLSVASNAVSAVQDLLSQKEDLQSRLTDSNSQAEIAVLSEEKTQIQSQISTIDSSITSIISNATFNDQNVFDNSGNQISIGGGSNSYSIQLNIPNFPSLTGTAETDLSAVGSLEASLVDKTNIITSFVSNLSSQRSNSSDKVSADAIESLVQNIASQISSPYNTNEMNQMLIDTSSVKLNPSKVSDLTI